ncbi:MAG: hypothetical protein ACRDSQ_16750, partial [Actinokineospora sp.]
AHITAPGFDTDLDVPVVVEKTAIPASGGFTVRATGKTPSLKFPQAGPIKITVHDLLLNITARKADGTLASIPPSNPFDAPCAQDPGQNNVLKEGQILPAPSTTTPTTTTTVPTTTTTEPTTTGPTTTEPTTTEPTTTEPTSTTQPTTEPTTTEPTTTAPTTTAPTTEPTTTEPTTTVTTLPVVNTQIPSGGGGGYVPTNTSSHGELANTGSSVAWPLGIGLLLIGLGANMILVMRLRARRR